MDRSAGPNYGNQDGSAHKRGTAEQSIEEGKYALKWTRFSCHDFVENQVPLQLFALACKLRNPLRPIKSRSTPTVCQLGAKNRLFTQTGGFFVFNPG